MHFTNLKFSEFLAKRNFKMTLTTVKSPEKTTARDVANNSLKNSSFPSLKGFVMIANHTYTHYSNPEMRGQFNNVAIFTIKRDLWYVDYRYFFPVRINIGKLLLLFLVIIKVLPTIIQSPWFNVDSHCLS